MKKGMKILNLNLFNGFHQTILAAEFMGVQQQPQEHLQPLESINCANSNISSSLTLSSFFRRLFLCFRCSSTRAIVSQESIEKFSAQLNWIQFIVSFQHPRINFHDSCACVCRAMMCISKFAAQGGRENFRFAQLSIRITINSDADEDEIYA